MLCSAMETLAIPLGNMAGSSRVSQFDDSYFTSPVTSSCVF